MIVAQRLNTTFHDMDMISRMFFCRDVGLPHCCPKKKLTFAHICLIINTLYVILILGGFESQDDFLPLHF
jgi:hypothetical protein